MVISELRYDVKRRKKSLLIFLVMWSMGVASVVTYTFLKINTILGIVLFLLFILVCLWGINRIGSMIPVRVTIDDKGIALNYSKISKFVLSPPLYISKNKNESRLAISGNSLLIKWENVEDIQMGNGWTKLKYLIKLKNGDRVYLLNNVDWEIRKAVKEAWEKWKARSKEDLNKKKG